MGNNLMVRIMHAMVVESVLDRLFEAGMIEGLRHRITDRGRIATAGLAKFMSEKLLVKTLWSIAPSNGLSKKTCKDTAMIARKMGVIADRFEGGEKVYFQELEKAAEHIFKHGPGPEDRT